jgi:hypothetical protein
MSLTEAVLLINSRAIDGVMHADWLYSASVSHRDFAACESYFDTSLQAGREIVSLATMVGSKHKWCIS